MGGEGQVVSHLGGQAGPDSMALLRGGRWPGSLDGGSGGGQ